MSKVPESDDSSVPKEVGYILFFFVLVLFVAYTLSWVASLVFSTPDYDDYYLTVEYEVFNASEENLGENRSWRLSSPYLHGIIREAIADQGSGEEFISDGEADFLRNVLSSIPPEGEPAGYDEMTYYRINASHVVKIEVQGHEVDH